MSTPRSNGESRGISQKAMQYSAQVCDCKSSMKNVASICLAQVWRRRRWQCGFCVLVLLLVTTVCLVHSLGLQLITEVKFDTGHRPARLATVQLRGFPENVSIPCDWTPQRLASLHHIDKNTNRFLCQRLQSPANPSSHDGTSYPETAPPVRPKPTSLAPNVTSCLRRIINENCDVTHTRVPPLAHYVSFGRRNLSLDHFVSVLSVARSFKPCLVIFHGDEEPEGLYWTALLAIVPQIVFTYMERPFKIFNRVINRVEHSADVARLRILIEHGGVYLDPDHVVLNSLQDLLNESLVLGIEVPRSKIGNGFLISKPNATFLRLWLNTYRSFNDRTWAYHSTVIPHKLFRKFPHLARLVDSFFKPGFSRAHLFFSADRSRLNMDWHQQHGVHIYTRRIQKYFFGQPRVDRQENTMGDIVRFVLYGDECACM